MLRLPSSIVLASAVVLSTAVIFESVSDLPNVDYDYIVVGGGTAGNVIANRLTENPDISLLVLEAGGSNENVLDSMVPFYCTRITPSTLFDWNFTTTPQTALNGRALSYPRGYMLGGSSSVNYMAYTRGSSEDYDRYAQISGDDGWSWENLQPYIRKNEMFGPSADHHNTTGQFDPSFHGFHGINGVSLPGFSQPIDKRVVQTTNEISEEFPFNLDTNSGNHIGIAWQPSTIKAGARSSSATSYLGPQYILRSNLHVLVHAQVTRILQAPSSPSTHPFTLRTVEFAQSFEGKRHRFTATKEVILSAGSVGTPHILLNSGIGDSETLTAVGIKPIMHLPSVGRNLTDHAQFSSLWLVNSTNTFDTALRNASLAAEQLELWKTTRTGPLVVSIINHTGWLRLPNDSEIFREFPDPSAGPHTAHFELIFINGVGAQPPPTGNFLGISTAVVSPASRGYISINSSNPFDPPVINPNLLSSPFDMFVMREAIRSARRFVSAPAWADYIISPVSNSTTDAELDEDIRSGASSVFHPVGTASMSPEDAGYGVVNPDLRVKGVIGLRIVDASVIPLIPTAHTQVPVYIFAERAADLIKAAQLTSRTY